MATVKPGQMRQTRVPSLSGEADVREEVREAVRCFFNDLWGHSYLRRKRKKRSWGPSSSATTLDTVRLPVKSSMIRIWYLLKQNGWGGGGKSCRRTGWTVTRPTTSSCGSWVKRCSVKFLHVGQDTALAFLDNDFLTNRQIRAGFLPCPGLVSLQGHSLPPITLPPDLSSDNSSKKLQSRSKTHDSFLFFHSGKSKIETLLFRCSGLKIAVIENFIC